MTDRTNLAWYVCGPMTGIPRFNYPLFALITANLRLGTVPVVSPAELDSQEMQAAALASPNGKVSDIAQVTTETWGDVLARDVRLIEKQIGRFALLPGWQASRGARLEVFVGLLVGITEYHEVSFGYDGTIQLTQRELSYIRDCIRQNMP